MLSGHHDKTDFSPTDFTINRFWLDFRDAEVERDYQRFTLPRRRGFLRVLLFFTGCLFLIYPARRLHLLEDGLAFTSLLPHLTQAAVWFALAAYLHFGRVTARAVATLSLGVSLVSHAGLIALAWRHADAMSWDAKFVILLLVSYTFLPVALRQATFIALGASAAYGAMRVMTGPVGMDWVPLVVDLLIANVFGQLMAREVAHRTRKDYQLQCEFREQSVRDHLTGCFNRRYLNDTLLPAELARARRQQACLSVILCDIDHFKMVNDVHGHQSGDMVLRQFATLLRARVQRGGDCVVRYGGEEFLILLPGADLQAAVAMAEELRLVFAQLRTVAADGRSIATTASFGVSSVDFSDDAGDVSDRTLIQDADTLLYEAKRAGRNTVRATRFAPVPSV